MDYSVGGFINMDFVKQYKKVANPIKSSDRFVSRICLYVYYNADSAAPDTPSKIPGP